jgi:hypothetical protein
LKDQTLSTNLKLNGENKINKLEADMKQMKKTEVGQEK